MNIVIIGAGFAGLTCALALAKQGHQIHLFDKRILHPSAGLGVGLQDFAVAALSQLVPNCFADDGLAFNGTCFLTRKGEQIYHSNKSKLGIRRSVALSHLLDRLAAQIGQDHIHLHHQLVSLKQTANAVTAQFKHANHETYDCISADIMIGADGLNSMVRSQLFPKYNQMRYSGITTWRGLSRFHNLTQQQMVLMGDREAKAVIYPIHNFDDACVEYYWAAEVKQPHVQLCELLHNKQAQLAEFSQYFVDFELFGTPLSELHRQAHTILKFPIVDKDPLSTWYRQRAILIGDAAHPMYPMGGNGASQAIIDAIALANCLDFHSDFNDAFVEFCLQRVEKVNKIVLNNRSLGPDKILVTQEQARGNKHYCQNIIEEYKNLTQP